MTNRCPDGVINDVLRRFVIGVLRETALWHLPPDLMPGDVCSIKSTDGSYSIAKVISRHRGTLRVCVYKEKFPKRPERVDFAALTVPDADALGMQHLLLSNSAFGTWTPIRIHQGQPNSLGATQIDRRSRFKKARRLAS